MTLYLFDNNVSNSCEQCLLLLLLQPYYSPTQFNGIKYHMCYVHSLVILYVLDNLSCLKLHPLCRLDSYVWSYLNYSQVPTSALPISYLFYSFCIVLFSPYQWALKAFYVFWLPLFWGALCFTYRTH